MFMVKDEITNIKNLLRVRHMTQAKGLKLVFFLLGLYIFLPFTVTVIGILRSDSIRFYNIADFSLALLFGIGIAYFINMLTYRSTNDKLSVYPQTNSSRFISSLLYNFIGVFALVIFVLGTYLIRYIVILLMTVFMDNVHLALDFDLGLIVLGFFVYVAYCLLIVAAIELVGVILRKWTYYAIVGFTAVLSVMIANFGSVVENMPYALAFLIKEPSLTMFFIKAVGLLIVFIAIAIVINRCTVYYGNQGHSLNKGVVVGCIIVTVAVTAVLPSVLFTRQGVTERTVSTASTAMIHQHTEEFFTEEIHIDISHLPNGSTIDVQVANRGVVAEVVTGATFFSDRPVSISGAESLRNIQGDTLIISYHQAFFQVNGMMLSDFADMQFIAYLDGNTLFVDNIIENVQVVILPIWGIARQFDFFSDRDIFRANMIGFSAGGATTASVLLRVE